MESFTILDKCVGLYAKRNSGKSRLLKYLVSLERQHISRIFVICPTEEINSYYTKDGFVDPNCVYGEWDENWVEGLIETMTRLNANKQKDEQQKCILILDDICSDAHLHQSDCFKKLCARSRHFGLGVIVTLQNITQAPPIFRNNCDWVFTGLLPTSGIDLISQIYRVAVDKKRFEDLYIHSTKDFNFMVINCCNVRDCQDLRQVYTKIKVPKWFIDQNE
jgi:hypothetical protein